MIIIFVVNAPPRLRGRLSTYLLELAPGLYAGHAPTKTREALWEQTVQNIEDGSAVLAWPDSLRASGLSFKTTGTNSRKLLTIDGLDLINFPSIMISLTEPSEHHPLLKHSALSDILVPYYPSAPSDAEDV